MKRAMILAAVLVVVGGAAAGLRADDVKPDGDLKTMQGTWVRAEGGEPEVKWVIKGDTLKATVGDRDYTCKLALDPKATPHRSADIVIKEGADDSAGKTSRAIYKFDGDTMIFCVSTPGGENRPTEFKGVEGESFLFTLKKEG